MRKIIFAGAFLAGILGVTAQNIFVNQNAPSGHTAIDNLLDRKESIGTVSGGINDYFSVSEQRMLNVHFNGLRNLAPVTVTQTTSQNIEAGAGIACASPVRFTDNSLYRVFDLVGDHGINNGLTVNAVQFGFDEGVQSHPEGFPVTVNVYSIDNASDFPGVYNNMTLEGTGEYIATSGDSLTVVDVDVDATIPAGKAMVVELKLVNDGTDTNYMRFGCNMDTQSRPAYIMAADCGANTPTKFTDLGLTNALILNVLGDDEPGSAGESTIYGIENSSEQLVSFDVDDTTLNILGSSIAIDFENAGGIDPNDQNTAYSMDAQGRLFKIDLTTGVYTSLGTVAPAGGQTWTGGEFDPTSGDFYAVSSDLVSTGSLYKIDLNNVSKTLIGTNSAAGAISLMIDGNGNGYLHDITDDSFYGIDIATGAATYIGPLGFDANYGQGGTWVPGDEGYVYLSAFNNDTFQGEWRRLDVSTGSSTLIAPIVLGGDLAQVAWSAAVGVPVVGIAELELDGFNFYPNPAKENISLKADNKIESVQMYNIIGQRVLDVQLDAKSAEINVSHLTPGIHLMKVTINGQAGTYRVLKN